LADIVDSVSEDESAGALAGGVVKTVEYIFPEFSFERR
ncbi:hypothetical protein AVEN_206271-1, partial [Araneus ventricosus]